MLDRRKDEAILRTFHDVAKHFSNVMKELVPGGSGRLIMHSTHDAAEESKGGDDDDEEERTDEDAVRAQVSAFTGIGFAIDFTGHGEASLLLRACSADGVRLLLFSRHVSQHCCLLIC